MTKIPTDLAVEKIQNPMSDSGRNVRPQVDLIEGEPAHVQNFTLPLVDGEAEEAAKFYISLLPDSQRSWERRCRRSTG